MTTREGLDPETGVHGEEAMQERIRELIRDRLHVDIEDPDLDLFETGLIDSLGLVELLLGLETEFGIRIVTDDLDIEHFRSLDRTTTYVKELRSSAGPLPS